MSKKDKKKNHKGSKTVAPVQGTAAIKIQEESPEIATAEITQEVGKTHIGITTPVTKYPSPKPGEGTPLTEPVKTEQSEKVLTSAKTEKETFKGDSEILPSLKEELKEDVKTAKETVKADAKPDKVTPGQAVPSTTFSRTKEVRGKTVNVILTKAMEKIKSLTTYVEEKGFGKLKPDTDDFLLKQFEAEVINSSATHIRKALTALAENLSPETYKHFMAHSKISELHWLSQIDRTKNYVIHFGR